MDTDRNGRAVGRLGGPAGPWRAARSGREGTPRWSRRPEGFQRPPQRPRGPHAAPTLAAIALLPPRPRASMACAPEGPR